jgi:hypothetical protein
MVTAKDNRAPTHAPRALLVTGLAISLMLAVPAAVRAARVSGRLLTYHGAPYASRDLHFENCVTLDIYLSPTHSDGSFAQSLPPGCYDLRAEHGAILARSIIVGDADVTLGPVSELAPLAPQRLFELQSIFPTLLSSPAPSTAYVFTHDSTVVPPTAAKVPVPTSESEWVKLQKQINSGMGAQAGLNYSGTASGMGAAPPAPNAPEFEEPMNFGAVQPGSQPQNLPQAPEMTMPTR